MSERIGAFSIWRLEVPLGRVIGDSTCSYDRMQVVAVSLSTDAHGGWGLATTVEEGSFSRPAFWIRPMPSLAELETLFRASWWQLLSGAPVNGLPRPGGVSDVAPLDSATRMAIWDLEARCEGVPLYSLLADRLDAIPQRSVPAYGSLLDFPLDEADAVAKASWFVSRGFNALKVKVGAVDVDRDLRRLAAVRAAVGPTPEIAADANEAWDADEALARLEAFRAEGFPLAYIEDPLPASDLKGFVRLQTEGETPVAAHDYVNDPAQIEAFLQHRAVNILRATGEDVDLFLETARLAQSFGVPIRVGNSVGEIAVHFALATPAVERIEYADLAWNELFESPLKFMRGRAWAPRCAGHGLTPRAEVLARFARPS